MAENASSSSSSRRRSRGGEWRLPAFLIPRRTRPLKFQVGLVVHALTDYPQSGVLFVKAREIWKEGMGKGCVD